MTEATTTDVREIPFQTADGGTTTLSDLGDKVFLVVNLASKCGLTPQYEQLEQLQKAYAERGFSVVGFPSNQFLQEPGSTEEILDYCATTWGVSFPVFDKVKVNGRNAAPLYKELKDSADETGRVTWNFEKFVVLPDGTVRRFSPKTKPDDPSIVSVIEANLPG
ncbi:glutathione peroxidase [Microbacterium aoyamense]|uniref:Glutathione peroxidase n=1 Tax=Microbacterium aoyamense TaxID=344166 RepID=A0ABN2P8N4_9MICO|nr:glutathione peroxidase [Microbacterium aoyamense]